MTGKVFSSGLRAARSRSRDAWTILVWSFACYLGLQLMTGDLSHVAWAQKRSAESAASADGAFQVEGAQPHAKLRSAKDAIPTDPIGLFLAGGPLMWPLLLSSIVAVWVALERLVALRRRRVIPRAFVDRFIQHLEQGQLNSESALRVCEENGSPMAAIFAHGIHKWGKPSVEVEQSIIDGAERQIGALRNHLRTLHGVYTIAPMLGLLGTVWGMIHGFNDMALADPAEKAARLAQHIAVAFLSTAGGLAVAIPALVLYMYFSGRVDSLVREMDLLAQRVVHLISAEALSGRPRQLQKANALGSGAPAPMALKTKPASVPST